jgi:hypothetical protein
MAIDFKLGLLRRRRDGGSRCRLAHPKVTVPLTRWLRAAIAWPYK